MQEGDNLLNHINKVKTLTNHVAHLEVPMKNEDVVMIFLTNLLPSYKHLITALNERTDYGIHDGMFDEKNVKEKGTQGDDTA